jgi:D-3-phosphoglycerate dehydrogenase
MAHVVVTGPIHPAGVALLERADGVTWDYVTDPDPAAYVAHLAEADGLVLRTQPLTEAILAEAPRLRIVSRHGVGYDAVDTAALDRRDIPLAIVGDVNSRTVAEHALMLLLAASRILVQSATLTRRGDWGHRNDFGPREAHGRTLLIVGFGRIGRHLAAMARAVGCTIVAYDPHLPDTAFDGVRRATDLKAALAEADLVSVHVPKTDGALIGAAEIAGMKPDAVIVNTARGGVVDEAALAEALGAGRLRAAALDVLVQEPPPADHPLLQLDNCIVTPHSAGLTAECAARMAAVAVQNVLDHFAGRLDPALVVNAARPNREPLVPPA